MRSGRRLAIDVGKVRIGVAASDFHGILASGIETVPRQTDQATAIDRVSQLVAELEPIEIYVGLPVAMSGKFTDSTTDAIDFATRLAAQIEPEVRLIDERMTTISAANQLKSSGRDSKSGRKIIDQIAATVILEMALAQEKTTDTKPGMSIKEIEEIEEIHE